MSMFENLRAGNFGCDSATLPLKVAAAADTATLTVAKVVNALLVGTPTAAANYTLPTAASIIAALGMIPGDSFDFIIRNVSAGAFTITLVTATGITLATGNTNTIAQANTRKFKVVCTAAGALTVYSMGATTH